MKVTTCAMVSPKSRQPSEREKICMWWSHTNTLFWSLLTDPSLVLCSASVLVTTGSMRWYPQSSQVTQVVQLLQAGTSMCVVSQHRPWGRYQETGCYMRRAEDGCKSISPVAGRVSALLWRNRRSTARVKQNDLQQARLSETDSMMCSSGTCAHSPAPCSLIGICKSSPEH